MTPRSRFLATLLLVVSDLYAGQVLAQTVTTTTYSYNADGALTRVVEQVDEQPPTTTYLTWDNCVPDSTDPTTCAEVTAGNGNLVAVGPVPGTGNVERSFTFDPEDRLIETSDADGSVSYRFHPTWLMASSTLDDGDSQDTRYFYYDHAGPARMTNIEDSGSGLLSAELGPLRSLSDGGLQVLLSPRKDVAGVYDPALGTFSPYRYDPFGDDGEAGTAAGAYDLNDNPNRYAGQYKDPTWGGYYLRARWYDPARHIFISRDPVANLNRYGYTDGNPIGRVDPDGRSAKPWRWGHAKQFMKKDLRTGRNGWRGVLSRLFLAPVTGPLALVADPGAFWRQQWNHQGGFRGIVSISAIGMEIALDVGFPEEGYAAFGARLIGDAIIGGGTSAANAVSNKGGFSWRSFAQGLEYTAGGMFYTRVVAGRGYRPFNLTADDVFNDQPELGLANVYRVKRGAAGFWLGAGPVGDALNLSLHHELLIAVTSQGDMWISEVSDVGLGARLLVEDSDEPFFFQQQLREADARFKFVGQIAESQLESEITKNPLRLRNTPNLKVRSDADLEELKGVMGNKAYKVVHVDNSAESGYKTYSLVGRNCQNHVSAMIKQMNFVQ